MTVSSTSRATTRDRSHLEPAVYSTISAATVCVNRLLYYIIEMSKKAAAVVRRDCDVLAGLEHCSFLSWIPFLGYEQLLRK